MHDGVMSRSAWISALALSLLGCGDAGVDRRPACDCPLTLTVDNTSMCGAESSDSMRSPFITSTYIEDGALQCGNRMFPPAVPAEAWGRATINSECAGSGQLCFALKAGSKDTPGADDCVLASQCVDFDYAGGNELVQLPAFDGWAATDVACLARYEVNGGYFEFRVDGTGVGCRTAEEPEPVLRVQNCPLGCGDDPKRADCVACLADATGDSSGEL
jgi:hypothetical protein